MSPVSVVVFTTPTRERPLFICVDGVVANSDCTVERGSVLDTYPHCKFIFIVRSVGAGKVVPSCLMVSNNLYNDSPNGEPRVMQRPQ